MCDGVVPTDSSWSMSGHQESVGVHVDAHSQHVVFDVVSWCGPFRHPLLRHHEGPLILTHGLASSVAAFFRELWPAMGDSRARTRSSSANGMGASPPRRIRADWGGVQAADKSLTTSRAWVGAGCGDKGKNSRDQLTFDPTDRGRKPLQDRQV